MCFPKTIIKKQDFKFLSINAINTLKYRFLVQLLCPNSSFLPVQIQRHSNGDCSNWDPGPHRKHLDCVPSSWLCSQKGSSHYGRLGTDPDEENSFSLTFKFLYVCIYASMYLPTYLHHSLYLYLQKYNFFQDFFLNTFISQLT